MATGALSGQTPTPPPAAAADGAAQPARSPLQPPPPKPAGEPKSRMRRAWTLCAPGCRLHNRVKPLTVQGPKPTGVCSVIQRAPTHPAAHASFLSVFPGPMSAAVRAVLLDLCLRTSAAGSLLQEGELAPFSPGLGERMTSHALQICQGVVVTQLKEWTRPSLPRGQASYTCQSPQQSPMPHFCWLRRSECCHPTCKDLQAGC